MNELTRILRIGVSVPQTGPLSPTAVTKVGHIFFDGAYRSKCSAEHFDRLAKVEAHTHLPDGGRQMQWFMTQHGIRPQPRLSSTEEHEARLHALADVLARYEGKAFGGLRASHPLPDEDRPLIHARLLNDSAGSPLCGATDGPWNARAFDFLRLTCHECRTLVLNPERASN
jgi:hypothetical protein